MTTSVLEKIKNIDITPTIIIDQPLLEKHIGLKLFDQIQALRPFGRENEKPVFIYKNVVLKSVQFLGSEGKHIKIISAE